MNGHVDLIQYVSLRKYVPRIGDVIIHHGWLSRTKWFAVIIDILPDGTLRLAQGSIPLLLFTTAESGRKKIDLSLGDIQQATQGSYSIVQQVNGASVWYV